MAKCLWEWMEGNSSVPGIVSLPAATRVAAYLPVTTPDFAGGGAQEAQWEPPEGSPNVVMQKKTQL